MRLTTKNKSCLASLWARGDRDRAAMVARELADANPDWTISRLSKELFDRGYMNLSGRPFPNNDVCHLLTISEMILSDGPAEARW